MISHPQPLDERTEKKYNSLFSHKVENCLDSGSDCCILCNSYAVKIVEETMKYDDRKY